MDQQPVVLEVHGGKHDGHDVRAAAISELRLLTISPDLSGSRQVEEILRKYDAIQHPKDHIALFYTYLTQRRDAWFVEIGDEGLLYITDIIPQLSGKLSVVFWDGCYTKVRRQAIWEGVTQAMHEVPLHRLSVFVPVSFRLAQQMYKKLGFVFEGVLRHWFVNSANQFEDAFVYGLLKDDFDA